MSKRHFDDLRGTSLRRKMRVKAVKARPEYLAAMGVMSGNSPSCVHTGILLARLKRQCRAMADIHAFEASRPVELLGLASAPS